MQRKISRSSIVAIVLGLALTMSTAGAGTFVYDNAATGTTTQWSAGTNWTPSPIVSATDTTLNFSATLASLQTVTSNNDMGLFQLNRLNFTYAGPSSGTAPTVLISGNQLEFINDGATTPVLNIAATGTRAPGLTISNDLLLTNNLSVTGASTATISGVISGGGSISKSGAGSLTLNRAASPANSFSGGLTVNGGTVLLSGAAQPLGTGAVTIGGGSIGATLANSVANANYTNAITVSPTTSGTLSLTNNGASSRFSGAITLNADLTISINGTSTNRSVVASGQITGSSTLTTSSNSGGSAQILGANTTSFTGNVIISKGTLLFNSGSLGSSGTITFTVGTTQTLQWNTANTEDVSSRIVLPTSGSALLNLGANNVTFNSGIAGTGGMTKVAGTGILTLAAANGYTGPTTIKGGTLALGAAGTIASTSIVVGDTGSTGAILDLTAKSAYTVAAGTTLSGIGTVNLGAGKTLTLSGNVAPGNSVGTLSVTGDVATGTTGKLLAEVTSDVPDVLAITGDLDLTAVGDVLDVTFTDTPNLDRYVLVTYTGSRNGTFDTLNVTGATGWLQDYSVANEVAIVVPEPASLGLLAMAGLGLMRRRRA